MKKKEHFDKKKIILAIITLILFLIVIFLGYLVLNKYVLKNNFENSILPFANKNENTIFKIDKIVLFSGADSKTKNIASSNYTIENLYQYTDIALFVSINTTEKNLENTFKRVWIDNIKFNTTPSLGDAKLYFKSINDFSKSTFDENNIIQDSLEFNVVSDNETDLSEPNLYNNLANPITLTYVNQNIKSDYTITDTSSPITYDGSLLKKCNVSLDSINSNISFDVNVINNLDQEFKCTAFIDIPLTDDNNKTIYDGNINIKKDTNFIFYRYK